MTKQELLDFIKKNKNTEHKQNHLDGSIEGGFDYDEVFCVVYINDDDYQHGPCTSDITICFDYNRNIKWLTIPINTIKELMEDKENEYIWKGEFYFEYEAGNLDGADSYALKIDHVDCKEITFVVDEEFDSDKFAWWIGKDEN